jgi:hypothetical protein
MQCKLLLASLSLADTYIITNAAKGWVEFSSQLLMPKIHKVMEENKVKIISARSDFEKKFPGQTKRWKREAFVEISKQYTYDVEQCSNLAPDQHSLSGRLEHRDGGSAAVPGVVCPLSSSLFCDKSSIKTVKFEEKPDPVNLIKQQQHVTKNFEKIFKATRNKMIYLEK